MVRNLIAISDHPTIAGLTRKAQVFRTYNEYDTKRVVLNVKVYHYDSNGDAVPYLPEMAQLICDNDVRVNPATGEIVEAVKDEDGSYPAGTVGEYDFLWSLVNVAKAKTQVELEDMYVPLRVDSLNKKMYGI